MGNDTPGMSSRASSMRPPPVPPLRVPLMTPSASPPVQRPYGRQADGPSPTKKRRVSRIPSLLGPGARSYSTGSTSSSSVPPPSFSRLDAPLDPDEDLDSARRASSFKVLNVWSSLAAKYARRLDEDDIVDLENETIVKDYGVLSSSDDMYTIGCFADQHEREDRQGEEEPFTAVDDEPDELDAFSEISENVLCSGTDGEDNLELARQPKRLPPVRELDPADAADLAEFLEAERARKERFGDPDEDENEDEEGSDNDRIDERRKDEDQEDRQSLEGSTVSSKSVIEIDDDDVPDSGDSEGGDFYDESVHDEDGGHSERGDYRSVSTPSGSPEFDIIELADKDEEDDEVEGLGEVGDTFVRTKGDDDTLQVVTEDPLSPAQDGGSEDELGGWEQDEGNTVYSVGDFSADDFSDESPETGQLDGPEERTPTPTPDSSKATKDGPVTRHQKNKMVNRDYDDRTSFKTISSTSPVLQLQTPPRSSSFRPEVRHDRPIVTYSRKKQEKPARSKKTPLRITSTASEDSHSEGENATPLSSGRQDQAPRNWSQKPPASSVKKYRLVPEVIIDVPAHPVPRTAPYSRTEYNDIVDHPSEEPDAFVQQKIAKGKGKAKALGIDDHTHDHDAHRKSKAIPTRAHVAKSVIDLSNHSQDEQSERTNGPSINSKKRRRASSPVVEQSGRGNSRRPVTKHNSPPTRDLPIRSSSPRRDDGTRDERNAVPESRASSRRRSRSRSRPAANERDDAYLSSRDYPHPQPPPPTMYASPPEFRGLQGDQYPPPHSQHHLPGPLHNFQDSSTQYHLAQALQSLSILMGGTFPFPPLPPQGSSLPLAPSSAQMSGHSHRAWPPYTPRHRIPREDVQTPQSAASAPPTSSPVGSDYSDSLPSSPIKQHAELTRGRSRSVSRTNTVRLKSAIRGLSRSKSRLRRRVSFSSPEAFLIEDVVDDNLLQTSGAEDPDEDPGSDDDQDNRSEPVRAPRSRLNIRAETPGPPGTRGRSGSSLPTRNDVEQQMAARPGHRRAGSRASGMAEETQYVRRGKEPR
ncbi:hypothetical protein M0805_000134 [Coniferiporia weirii]|nr:hypothetical protein M0805_000134 [Coniferiporia weirii]